MGTHAAESTEIEPDPAGRSHPGRRSERGGGRPRAGGHAHTVGQPSAPEP